MSILIDLEGLTLSQEEQELLRHPRCAGVILFERNYENPAQLKRLTHAVSSVSPGAVIAVDQEGGRVQRFREGFTALPPMSSFGRQYDENPQSAYLPLAQTIHALSSELRESGINLNLIPVLDLNFGISAIIGERSLHRDPQVVTELGGIVIDELHRQGFPAVGKHFPGHGGVALDSHQDLPVDTRDWATLWHNDLQPFLRLMDRLDAIMPAHIVFSAIDSLPVSFSPFWLKEVLRRRLNFQGIIISDDLSMAGAATRGDYATRAVESFLAGCDLLLVSNNRAGAIAALAALLPYEELCYNSRKKVKELVS